MPTVTLSELDSRLLARLENNSRFWTTTERYAALNEGVKVYNLLTGFIQRSVTTVSVADQHIYDVPSGVLIPLRCKFGTRALTKPQVRKLNPDWLNETTSNTGIPVENWALIGVSKFAIWPADSLGGATIELTGVSEPTVLAQTTDVITIPNEFADYITEYAAMVCMFKAGGLVSVQAMQLFQGIQRRINETKRYMSRINERFYIDVEGAGE